MDWGSESSYCDGHGGKGRLQSLIQIFSGTLTNSIALRSFSLLLRIVIHCSVFAWSSRSCTYMCSNLPMGLHKCWSSCAKEIYQSIPCLLPSITWGLSSLWGTTDLSQVAKKRAPSSTAANTKVVGGPKPIVKAQASKALGNTVKDTSAKGQAHACSEFWLRKILARNALDILFSLPFTLITSMKDLALTLTT